MNIRVKFQGSETVCPGHCHMNQERYPDRAGLKRKYTQNQTKWTCLGWQSELPAAIAGSTCQKVQIHPL